MFSFGGKKAYKKQRSEPNANAVDYDYLYKVVLAGPSQAGKSSLLLRFCDNTFTDSFISTIGVEFKTRCLEIDGTVVKLQLWDTAGQERFRTITSSYYRGAHGCAMVVDINDPRALQHVQEYERTFDNYSSADSAKIIIGNKANYDESDRGHEVLKSYALTRGIPFIAVNCKSGRNVEAAFIQLASLIHNKSAPSSSASCNGAQSSPKVRLDVKKTILLRNGNDSDPDSDCESFASEELEEELNELWDDSNTLTNLSSTTKSVLHQRTDVNIFRLDLDSIEREPNFTTGDPMICANCGVLVNQTSWPLQMDGEQLSKAISETPPKSLLLAPPICPTVDEIYQARLSTPPAEVCQYWGCSFCDHYNPVPELDSKEMPQDDMVDYLIQPPPCLGDDSEGINIIFCIDVSGSMAVTTPVSGAFKLKGCEKRDALQRELQSRYGEGYIPPPSSITHVSRLQCVQSAVEQQIESYSRENPDTRIGIVTFNSDVTLIGDGTQETVIVTGDKLTSFDGLVEIGENFKVEQPIGKSKTKLLEELWGLQEEGKTALGPALQLSIAMASSRPGSSVILCTDGMANVGVGSLEDAQKGEHMQHYTEMAERALLAGVSVSLISLIGSECKLDSLSVVAERTSGSVSRVNPVSLTEDGLMSSLKNRPVIGYTVMAMVLLHSGLKFRGEFDDENEDRNWIVKDLGNVRTGKELTFAYSFRSKKECDLTGTDRIPFQVQLLYTRPNGMQCLRVATAEVDVTEDRIEAEKAADIAVVGVHAAQRAARYAKEGDFERAQMEARAAQRFMKRAGVEKQKVAAWSKNVNGLDLVAKVQRQKKEHCCDEDDMFDDFSYVAVHKQEEVNEMDLFA